MTNEQIIENAKQELLAQGILKPTGRILTARLEDGSEIQRLLRTERRKGCHPIKHLEVHHPEGNHPNAGRHRSGTGCFPDVPEGRILLFPVAG